MLRLNSFSPAYAMTAIANDVSLDSTDWTPERVLAPVIESLVNPFFPHPLWKLTHKWLTCPSLKSRSRLLKGSRTI